MTRSIHFQNPYFGLHEIFVRFVLPSLNCFSLWKRKLSLFFFLTSQLVSLTFFYDVKLSPCEQTYQTIPFQNYFPFHAPAYSSCFSCVGQRWCGITNHCEIFMNDRYMTMKMAFLFEARCASITSIGSFVCVSHSDVFCEPVSKGESSATLFTLEISFFSVNTSHMFVKISSLLRMKS